jgi:hypothetical protein
MDTMFYLSMAGGIVLSTVLLASTTRYRIRPVAKQDQPAGLAARMDQMEAFDRRALVGSR